MKIKFKHQQFQLDAVKSIVDIFKEQPNESSRFTLDKGRRQKVEYAGDITQAASDSNLDYGFKNNPIKLLEQDILSNIQTVQHSNGLHSSEKLEGKYNLTIEMETGTGKTYTYIRTMYELYKKYRWSKFIIVVPSIAIREGVLKTFQMTEDHFMSEYGSKARYFLYNSQQLHHIEKFASDSGINVMIINSQAFAARGKDARRIYAELDDFNSRKPIDVIASTNPIMIIDEPQSVEGPKTKESLKLFKPLFTLRYSATHREDYNKVYRLDALDAYNMKLVKKISVKGIAVKGTSGSNSYLYLEGIDVSSKHAPIARLEYEVRTKTGLSKKLKKISTGDDLYQLSNQLEQYKGYKVSEINGQNNSIHFINGVTLYAGDVQGDVSELHFRRIQIRETIKSHFEKERVLFHKGIKVLSLFFIDEVAKYRTYDQNNELNGIYAELFEEEYIEQLNEQLSLFSDDPYIKYLSNIQAKETHKGYFSIDKKSKKFVDSKVSARETDSDDADAYDLIMKDKERLLSFNEPTRFIFSHSALKEGWDNPNVFQICTLKHSDSATKKRQEVGRGLRLCVNQYGERIDSSIIGADVHEINALTVIASDSYEQFAKDLQKEIASTLSDRPRKVDVGFFLNKLITNALGEQRKIDEKLAKKIEFVFIRNSYVDENNHLTDDYFAAVEEQNVKVPEELFNYQHAIVDLVKAIYVEGKSNLAENEFDRNIKNVTVNANFNKKEFQELWNKINKKTAYTVKFDSDELIRNCIFTLDKDLMVPYIRYSVTYGEMDNIKSQEQLKQGDAFREVYKPETEVVKQIVPSKIKYDLVGKLMDETALTRKTIVSILKGIKLTTFLMFQRNPEEFILRTAKIINEQKATTIIESITYDIINDRFETDIFTKNSLNGQIGHNAISVDKHIYDFVVTDSKIERAFAEHLDISEEVQIYAKLPRGFFIPTPVGNYNPDWAIVFKEGDIKHIYFIAETKGTMDSMELREVEKAKIECARKHFAKLNSDQLKYDVVNNFEKLLDIVKS